MIVLFWLYAPECAMQHTMLRNRLSAVLDKLTFKPAELALVGSHMEPEEGDTEGAARELQ